MPQQGRSGEDFAYRVETLQKLHLVALQQSQRNAVTVENAVAGERRKFRSRRENAGEIERIGARQ